jgi:hypothetical protein
MALFEGAGNFQSWDLVEEGGNLGHEIGDYILPKFLPGSLCFLPTIR